MVLLSSVLARICLFLAQYGVAIKRARTEDEYFNSDEEEEQPEYQPKPGSPGPGNQDLGSDEDDPLDAYMKSLEKDVQKKGAYI